MKQGFSLIELLAAVAVMAILSAITLPLAQSWREQARKAASASNLRQLGVATQMYLLEHDDVFFPYREEAEDGVVWFFGKERFDGPRGEGNRVLDRSHGPLYPYIGDSGVTVCPGFDYNSPLWKPKFTEPSWSYGYNMLLGAFHNPANGRLIRPAKRFGELNAPSRVILFATCAQVNTFQAPASPANPMLEEFYFIDDTFPTVHFRFGGKALVLFADGHVREMAPWPGTLDGRLPRVLVGRLTPRGSRDLLE